MIHLRKSIGRPQDNSKEGRSRATPQAGFTLVELLVSLLIFSMIASSGVFLLSSSARAEKLSRERSERASELRLFGVISANDLEKG